MNILSSKAAVVTTVTIIRDLPEYVPSSRMLAASAFTVVDDLHGPRFTAQSVTLPPDATRDEARALVQGIIPFGSEAVLRIPRVPRGLRRQLRQGRPMPTSLDATALRNGREDLVTRPVCVSEISLTTIARFFGLTRADRDDTLAEKARRCAHEAQALYLTHLFTVADEMTRTRIAAGFEAWQALERAKPMAGFGPAEVF